MVVSQFPVSFWYDHFMVLPEPAKYIIMSFGWTACSSFAAVGTPSQALFREWEFNVFCNYLG